MQYLLTQEEYDALKNQGKQAKDDNKAVIQDLCTKVADHMPIIFWNHINPEPWGCILSTEDEAYCDECPVQKECPNPNKEYSQ